MKEFDLHLKPTDNFTIPGFIYPVIKNGLEIGTCRFISSGDHLSGVFSLENNIDQPQFLRYITKMENSKSCIASIEFTDYETVDTVQRIDP